MDITSLLLCSDILLFITGIYALCLSSFVIKIDKDKNQCTKETKYIWQKQYKVEVLCRNLSNIKCAIRAGTLGVRNLCLELKSGKKIVLLSRYEYKGSYYSVVFDRKVDEINYFFSSKDRQYIIKHSWADMGCGFIIVALLGLLFIYNI